MKAYNYLNIKGAVLDNEQLENYLEKIASDHILKDHADKTTYPIPRLKDNYKFITYVYKLLNEHIKMDISIHPAGEWILDNYYIIEETVKNIIKNLSKKKYTSFPGIYSGKYKGYARIYVLASEIIGYTDAKIEGKELIGFLQAYQQKKTLTMEEIWNTGIFLQIAIIENIRQICEKIYSSLMQKQKAEDIVLRLVENNESKMINIKTKENIAPKTADKYAFLEYISARLRKYGKMSAPFLEAVEDTVNKMGTDLSEVVKKEHFDIALRKVSMANSITSIKTINRIDFLQIFEKINGVEEILRNDPIHIYENMDYRTKEYYRNKIKEISKKIKISEIYVAKQALELSINQYNEMNYKLNEKDENINDQKKLLYRKKSHIGYYLVDNGKNILLSKLLGKDVNKISTRTKLNLYLISIYGISLVISIFIGINFYIQIYPSILAFFNNFALIYSFIMTVISSGILSLIFVAISFIMISYIMTQTIQYILGKIVKPSLIPKMDFRNGIPKESSTFVVIPTIISEEKQIKKLVKKLEVYYISNKTENMYFALLGDCSASDTKELESDDNLIKVALEEINKLNQKYETETMPKFHFIYRERTWNDGEEKYIGWERKRGLLNQFNEYILGHSKNIFKINTLENTNRQELPKIKYIITLDADTELILNSGIELIAAMSHVLNTPILNYTNDVVIDGHALMQPRVGIDLEAAQKSIFSKIFAGAAGTDSYTNAISDTYQDNFGEGIFTGKGIYDVEVFSKILNDEIPENTVLSHDLLEGNYLRCGLVTDVMIMDGYPSNYISYKKRLHRWIRGDFQISGWLSKEIIRDDKTRINPLNKLSKYKIFDNLFREITPITIMLALILYICLFNVLNIGYLFWIALLALLSPTVLDIVNRIIYRKDGEEIQKSFSKRIPGIRASIYRSCISIMLLPDNAYMHLDAIIRTIYRMNVSRKKLLEWTTSAEVEKSSNIRILEYYKNMLPNVIFGIIGFLLSFMLLNLNIYIGIICIIISVIWLITPTIMWDISRPINKNKPIDKLDKDEKEYLENIAKRTWSYFKENLNEQTHYLPPDNYQEDRKEKIAYRTSPTNIGLAMLAVISAYDMKFETLEDTVDLLKNMIQTINSMSKSNGHLYNWYNIKTLQPLEPMYVSTVDSGNFIGYLYIVKQWINKEANGLFDEKYEKIISNIIENTDFSKLYDYEKQLFSIGYDVKENKLTDSYYDLLASEARQASFVAIAKKDVEEKHWANLSRTLTVLNRYKGLVSWSGTSFEYLMPNINIPKYESSLLDETCRFMVMSQMIYAKKLGIPWGISESAFNLKDLYGNYQYKAFGIPWLGLKRGLGDEIVVSSYGSVLAITDFPVEVVENIKKLEKLGMLDKYGLYESIDFTPGRLNKNEEYGVVKTYMAHHQGLILLSINNLFNNNILQKRFVSNPEIASVDILLQERMPENIIITKERKEKVEKIKNNVEIGNCRIQLNTIDKNINIAGIIANENYGIIIDQKGNGYSKYNNLLINRFKKTDDEEQGIYFTIKDVKSNKIWYNTESINGKASDKYQVDLGPDSAEFTRTDGCFITKTKITVAPNEALEIRKLELLNTSNENKLVEITSYFEPVLSSAIQDESHKAFNNLFLKYKYENNILFVKRKDRNSKENDVYMATSLYTKNESIGDLEYEVDKEKFVGRNNFGVPEYIKYSKKFTSSEELVTNPIVAFRRTFEIPANDKIEISLLIAVGRNMDSVKNIINNNLNNENINRNFELSKVRIEEENKYLSLKGDEIRLCNKILTYLVFGNPLKKLQSARIKNNKCYIQSDLWKYGISGDLPIILVKIKDINDIYVVEQMVKIHEYLRKKNIYTDLVILNEEKENRQMYVKDGIQRLIYSKNISYLINTPGGIFELNNTDKSLFMIKASVIFDASKGNIAKQIEDMEEEYIKSLSKVKINKNEKIEISNPCKEEISVDMENLVYYNEIGGFTDDGKEYIIKINKNTKTPIVWSHILANENFGTLVTESMGGYTWYENSRLNRVTAWANNPVVDPPSEIIYCKDNSLEKCWSIGASPMPDENNYYIKYGFGYAEYIHNSEETVENLTVFVSKTENVKINLLNIKNRTPNSKRITLVYYIKPVIGEDEKILDYNMNLVFDQQENIITGKAIYGKEPSKYIGVTSSEKILSFTGSKKEFIGESNISDPDGLYMEKLSNENSFGEEGIIALQIEVNLSPYENKDISIILGADDEIITCKQNLEKYENIDNCYTQYNNVKKYWEDITGRIQIKTPIKSIDNILNGWIVYQTIVSRLWGRTAYYQSGGAVGFRDQLQDTLGLKYIMPEMLKNQIIKHAKHQFIEGDVEHWWHEKVDKGIRTRFSDDLLWLPYAVCEYIKITGDYSILDEKTSYKQGNVLENGELERYDVYRNSDIEETIYEHCIRAIEKGINIGRNGLPKIGIGDWNDGLSSVGKNGEGESVWLGFFLYDVLKKFREILIYKDNHVKAEKYKIVMENLKKALNTVGWDGRWYRRAFTDEGDILGTVQNEECKIDGIAQSWSVISEAGDNDKKYMAMSSLENHLVDKDNGIIKLLDPPFEKSKLEPGYIKAYIPGTRENGGQYTHAAIWAVIAESIMGNAEKATELLKMINPIEHSKVFEACQKYKVEPYVITADIYGKGNLAGRGGWSWYTGSSGWYYNAGIEYILGMKIENNTLKIEPCIPKDWKEYTLRYNYNNTIYNITVKNQNEKNKIDENSILFLNNIEQKSKQIPLEDNSGIKNILVEM